jgi:hypothetical protein
LLIALLCHEINDPPWSVAEPISDAWPYVSPFIPIIFEVLKGLVRKKRRKGDKTITRVKVEAKDEMVLDFNDHQIGRREPDPKNPMAVPDVSEMTEVPEEPESRPAPKRTKRPTKKATTRKPAKKAKPSRNK